MQRPTLSLLFWLALLTMVIPAKAEKVPLLAPSYDAPIYQAVDRSLLLLQKSLAEYPHHAACFSCHHQGVALFTLSLARAHGYRVQPKSLEDGIKHVAADLQNDLALYQKGQGQPGGVTRAGYALLALQSGGASSDAVTGAVADFLLQRDQDQGFWKTTSHRPPAEASAFTDTFLAIRALKAYGKKTQQEAITARIERARKWLEQTSPGDTEDRVFQLWGLKEAGAAPTRLQQAVKTLLIAQREDGGWAQLPDASSDAYATGSVLTSLCLAGGLSPENAAYKRGLQFLLQSQQPDGSWHVVTRSKPVQPYFESGFPHGKDQFISIAASGWATSALILASTFPNRRPHLENNNPAESPVALGSRVEMFVDDWLIERKQNVSLHLTPPVVREVVLVTDKPWEGVDSAYYTVIQEGNRIRLYYRGLCPADADNRQVTCYAESADGIHFTRPALGLFDFEGSRQNNIIWRGVEAHNFAPFLDTNPNTRPDARFKALAGINSKLYAFCSPDGLHWKKIQETPVLTDGAFDSLNTAFWDEAAGVYRCYSRFWSNSGGGVRAIQHCTSSDFLHWSKPEPNRYAAGVPDEHFYTNATRPCPGAPHQLLSFPKRFVPERKKFADYKEPGVSDAVFMSSRDGTHWDRSFLEAWVRPGRDDRNWTQRSNMPASGIVQLSPDEFSLYISEHYQWPDNRLRRLTVRKHGFASFHADHAGGEFTTRPLTFSGKRLYLNYATSAVGSVQIEVQDAAGKPLPGYTLSAFPALYGDELSAVAVWSSGSDLSSLIGKTVRFRFVLKDADIYALQTK